MEKSYMTAGVSPLRLRAGSDTSTLLESPPRPAVNSSKKSSEQDTSSSSTARILAVRDGAGDTSTAVRPRKRSRRAPALATNLEAGTAVGRYLRGLRPIMTEPDMIMKSAHSPHECRVGVLHPFYEKELSTMATASGGVCVLLAVFSGTVLVLLAVVFLGVCGICYSIRQRGALEYLPGGAVELLTRTTLLDFLTDTSVVDAIKTYMVFMMGLSGEETQGVLRSLPEEMRYTLTRPGLLHTLPRPLQGLLLPQPQRTSIRPLEAVASGDGDGIGRELRGRRQRRRGWTGHVAGGGDARANGGDEGLHPEEERDPPLGQLVWNPLPVEEMPPPPRQGVDQAARDPLDNGSDSEVESDSDDNDDASRKSDSSSIEGIEEEGGVAQARDGDLVLADNDSRTDHRRPPWRPLSVFASPRARSLSPASADDRGGRRGRALTDAILSNQPRSPRRSSAAGLESAGGALGANRTVGGGGAPPTESLIPSAERIVASILQRRADSAMRDAWSLVDERIVRRAAFGSGVVLAAHVVLSERARRQASSMIRGSLLAALAGTVAVSAGLTYLKTARKPDQAHIIMDVDADSDQDRTVSDEDIRDSTADGLHREEGRRAEQRPSLLRKYGKGLRLFVKSLTPSARNMIRLLGMICVLLAVRKWQLLRRAAIRAALPRTMYGNPSP